MEVQYKNNKIRKVCTNANTARKEYGNTMAEKIHMRIDQIAAADSVEQLVLYHIGRCHRLQGDRYGQYAMDLLHPYRMIFLQIGNEIQIAEIQEIVDYH